MRQYNLPAGTRVTLVSPERVSEEKTLEGDVAFFEDDFLKPGHWGFRLVKWEENEIGFALTDGWGAASQGILIVESGSVKMDGGK